MCSNFVIAILALYREQNYSVSRVFAKNKKKKKPQREIRPLNQHTPAQPYPIITRRFRILRASDSVGRSVGIIIITVKYFSRPTKMAAGPTKVRGSR